MSGCNIGSKPEVECVWLFVPWKYPRMTSRYWATISSFSGVARGWGFPAVLFQCGHGSGLVGLQDLLVFVCVRFRNQVV